MVYSNRKIASKLGVNGEAELLSTTEVMKELGITKVTLYKWILMRKVVVRRYQIGTRTYNGFDPAEVKKLKEKMVKKREPGKPLIKE